jgi:hypothetical protein
MKLSIFGEVSWRWHFSTFGCGSAIAQKLAKEKTPPISRVITKKSAA